MKTVKKGDAITAEGFNEHSAELETQRARQGRGISIRRTRSGTVITAKNQKPLVICELQMVNASVESQYAVSWTAGRIANRKPTGFNTRGMIEPLQVLDDDEYHHFFAKCTYNTTTGLWVDAEITEEDEDVENTATIAYYLIGWAIVEDGVLLLSPPMCGPILPRTCDLKNTYAV
jgi:hypothetical protein